MPSQPLKNVHFLVLYLLHEYSFALIIHLNEIILL